MLVLGCSPFAAACGAAAAPLPSGAEALLPPSCWQAAASRAAAANNALFLAGTPLGEHLDDRLDQLRLGVHLVDVAVVVAVEIVVIVLILVAIVHRQIGGVVAGRKHFADVEPAAAQQSDDALDQPGLRVDPVDGVVAV